MSLLLRETTALARRDAQARPSSFNPEARTVEAVIATTTPVSRRDERGEYLEILEVGGADLEAFRGASVLNAHQAHDGVSAIIGTVEAAWREGDQLIARLRLSGREELRSLVEDIGSGIIASVSVGYEVSEWRDGEVDGQRTRTAVKWRPREVSFVPVPADPAARTRSIATRAAINRQIRALASRAGVSGAVVDDLIDREATIDEARTAMFENLVTRGRTPLRASTPVTTDDPAVFVRAVGEALYCRVAPHHPPSGVARQYVNMPVPDIARECLHRAGASTIGMYGDALINRALHTTSDFPLILADTIGRTLRDAYASAPSGIRQLGREASLPDFRTRARLMLDSTGFELLKTSEHGEFRSGTLAEAGESYRLDTYGRIFGITRQALVNDDLGAFTDLTRRLGQAAAAFEAQFLVNLLESGSGSGPRMSDGVMLFDASHGNLADTAGAPSEGTLSAARLAMRKQVGVQGGLISVTPRYLLVPSDLETGSEKLLTTIQATRVQDVNVFQNALTLVVEPRLTSPTRWYVVAAPAEIDGLEYAYLAGQPGPQIESQTGFRIDGIEMKIRLDYGAGFVDWRGWYSNGGAE
jgi:hypothetical protein